MARFQSSFLRNRFAQREDLERSELLTKDIAAVSPWNLGWGGSIMMAPPISFGEYIGGPGNDVFIDNNFITDTYNGAGGTDTVDYSAHTSNLFVRLSFDGSAPGVGANDDQLISIENIITGSGNDTVWGNFQTNRIETGAGNDTLLSNGGGDTLIGGPGDDYYYNVASSDNLIEAVNGGIDTVSPGEAVFTLPDNIENLVNNTASGDGVFTGNALANEMTGASGNDRIYGLGGNDTLSGGGGYDELYGGAGDDNYLLYPGYDETDLIVELENQGIDRITTYLSSYTLPDNVENLWAGPVLGLGHMFTGNGLANHIIGGEGNDVLSGLGGNDLIEGTSGNDALYGGDGDDNLNGGTGNNALYGGAGNDLLHIFPASSNTVIDGGDGYDTLWVRVTTTYTGTLSGIEQVQFDNVLATLTLNSQQVASGLAINASFTGHGTGAGAVVVNMLESDPLGATAFTFAPDVSFRVNGSSGDDIIKGPLTLGSILNGAGGADFIRGGNLVDTINSGDGNDKIMALGGADRITGGAGADQFRFFFAADSGVGGAADWITDFAIGSDLLSFILIDTDPVAAGDQGFAFIGTAAFGASGAAQMRYATSGSNLLVQADINGDGVADMEVVLQGLGGQTLTAGDFVL
jgi:Ca2+-binding RTX toxin-like protein